MKGIPLDCPPDEAEKVTKKLFKAIDGKTAKPRDFQSFAERKRPGTDLTKCNAWGLSVWADMQAVYHALGAYPIFKKKRIVEFQVGPLDGRLKCTPSKKQPDHHTFWKVDARVLHTGCTVVLKPEP